MINLLKVLSELVHGQHLHIYPDMDGNLYFKLQTDFGQEVKPFWVINRKSLEEIKFRIKHDELDESLAKDIEIMIRHMDDALINHEPESIYELDKH